MPLSTPLSSDIPTYSIAERDRRWTLARTFLEGEDLDALLVFGEHEDAGAAPFCFDTWFTNERAGMIVLFRREGDPIVFAPIKTYILDHLEGWRRGDQGWIEAENVRLGNLSGTVADTLITSGLSSAKVGVIGLEPYIPWLPEGIVPYRFWQNLLTQVPNIGFKPVGADFARLMMPLSKEEIAVVRHSAQIGDAMAQAMVDAARPGASEVELYAAGMGVAHKSGTVVAGMHMWTGPAPAASGPPQWAYRPQAPRILAEGDYIATEVFCGFGMRQTQHQVAIAIGEVHEDFERAAVIARKCYEVGLDKLRAGRRFHEVTEAMLAPVEAASGYVRGPQIHGLNPFGSFCRDFGGLAQVDGADRYPKAEANSTELGEMLLEPGMTFAFEPSCGFGRHLVTVGGTVIVGDDQAIELNAYTAQVLRAGG